jgi:tetratricopeptide (TPR) repeat protein
LHEALKCFDSALKLDEACARAWAGKGDVLTALGGLDGAIEAFQRFLRCAQSEELKAVTGTVEQQISMLQELRVLRHEAGKFGISVVAEGIGVEDSVVDSSERRPKKWWQAWK